MKLALAALVTAAALLLLTSTSQPSAFSWIRVATGQNVAWDTTATRNNQRNGRILYRVGNLGTADRANFVGPINEFQAIQRSFNVWRNIRGCRLDFEFDGTVDNPSANLNDDINTIYWTSNQLPPGTFAVTHSAFDTATGQYLDADLVFNDRDFAWDTLPANPTTGTPGRSYIEQIAVHEIGHMLGLDHTFLGQSSMFPFTEAGAINYLNLKTDDKAPLIDAYPDSRVDLPATASISGRVTSPAGDGRFGVQVVLIDVATRSAVIAAMSDRAQGAGLAGDYRIDGIPPGNYWVVASKVFTGELGSYYSSSFTDFLPTVRGVDTGTSGVPTMLSLAGGTSLTNIDLTVRNQPNPFEPNNTTAQATPVSVGHAVAAKIDTAGDVDWFSVQLVQGEQAVIHVHADSFGSELNPELQLVASDQTTVLVTGSFGQTGFVQSARDIEPSFFSASGVNFDAFMEHTAATSGLHYIRVRGTSNSTGDYVLTITSNATFAGVDPRATVIRANTPAAIAGGNNFNVIVEPRQANGVALQNSVSRTIELLDAANGDALLGTLNQPGPWSFVIIPPATPGELRYRVRVDSVMMLNELVVPVSDFPDAGQSSIVVLSGSLVADGSDSSQVEVTLRDAGGRLFADQNSGVQISTSAGTLTAGANTGQSVAGVYDPTTGIWRATLRAPDSGNSLNVSATAVAALVLPAQAVPLTAPASGQGGGGGGGGGGCALAGGNGGWPVAALLLLLGMSAVMRRRMPARACVVGKVAGV